MKTRLVSRHGLWLAFFVSLTFLSCNKEDPPIKEEPFVQSQTWLVRGTRLESCANTALNDSFTPCEECGKLTFYEDGRFEFETALGTVVRSGEFDWVDSGLAFTNNHDTFRVVLNGGSLWDSTDGAILELHNNFRSQSGRHARCLNITVYQAISSSDD